MQVEGVDVVVDTTSGRAQTPPPEAASPSSTGSFTLVDPPSANTSPLVGYLPELERLPPRVRDAPRGSQGAPGSSVPLQPAYSSSSVPPPFPSSLVVPEYPCWALSPLVLRTSFRSSQPLLPTPPVSSLPAT